MPLANQYHKELQAEADALAARNAELEAGLAELVDASQMANICDPRLDSALYEARELLEAK